MPGMSGQDLQAKLNAETLPNTDYLHHGTVMKRCGFRLCRAGAVEFLPKPFDDEPLVESVRAALER
jgi:FixJ family two-component response regulator